MTERASDCHVSLENGVSDAVRASRSFSVGALLAEMAGIQPDAVAVEQGPLQLSYREFNGRANCLGNALQGLGIARGDRVALLSENRYEYLLVQLACAKLGAITCCLNWRLSTEELGYCARLVEPNLLVFSSTYRETVSGMQHGASREICIDDDLGPLMESAGEQEPDVDVDPEDALIVVYTSGTTGFPKGAVISHRAMVARAALFHLCIGGDRDDAFIAWSGMFHMAGADFCMGTLLLGGRVVVVDGLDFPAIADAVAKYPVSYLGLQPGMVRRVVEYFEANAVVPKRIKAIGAMADLVAPTDLADVTRILQSPYLNTFGSTETGMAPASAGLLAIGEVPDRLSKRETPLTLVRLVDEDGRDVGFDTPGECLVRSHTLFSGYWKDEGATRRAFEGGWYHTGDVLTRHADGSFDYVERKSSMIKSGGENIYPAEIERVLLCDVRVTEACVVGAPDEKWGEVPVAFVARTDESFDSECALGLCRASLAGFKKPREVHFVESSWFPRSASGKIVRKEVKKKYPELLSSEKKSGRTAATGR